MNQEQLTATHSEKPQNEALVAKIYTEDVERAFDVLVDEWNNDRTRPYPETAVILNLAQFFYDEDEIGHRTLPTREGSEREYEAVRTVLQNPATLSRVLTLLAIKKGKQLKQVPTFEEVAELLEGQEEGIVPEQLVSLVREQTKAFPDARKDEHGNVVITRRGGEQLTVQEFVKRRNFNRLNPSYAALDIDRSDASIQAFSLLRGDPGMTFVGSAIERVSKSIESTVSKSDLEDWQKYYVTTVLLPRLQMPEAGEVSLRTASLFRNALWVMHSYRLCSIEDKGLQDLKKTTYRPRVTLEVADNAGEVFLAHARAFFGNPGKKGTGDVEVTGELLEALEAISAEPLPGIRKPRNAVPALIRKNRPKFTTIQTRHEQEKAEERDKQIDWEAFGPEHLGRGGDFEQQLNALTRGALGNQKRHIDSALEKYQQLSLDITEEGNRWTKRIATIRPLLPSARDTSPMPLEQQIKRLEHFVQDANSFLNVFGKAHTAISARAKRSDAQGMTAEAYGVIARAYETILASDEYTRLSRMYKEAQDALTEKVERQRRVREEQNEKRAQQGLPEIETPDPEKGESKQMQVKERPKREWEPSHWRRLRNAETSEDRFNVLGKTFKQQMPYVIKRVRAIREAVANGEPAPLSSQGRALADENVVANMNLLLADFAKEVEGEEEVTETLVDQEQALRIILGALKNGILLDPAQEEIDELLSEVELML